ncbi:MAG: ABC transporter substrate-binding protein [bacterium]
MTRSTISPPKSFNPVIAKETSTTEITDKMFVGLTRTDGVTGEVIPELAKNWQARKGGRIWEFELRRDLKWSDGEPLTAADVEFTYNKLYLNPDVPTSARFVLSQAGKLPEVEALSTYRVRFKYPRPYAPLPRAAGLEIMPRHVLADKLEAGKFESTWGVDAEPDSIVVNGPFKLEKYVTAQRVFLRKNPNYYRKASDGEKLPRLDRLIYDVVRNRELALQQFINGQIDVLSLQGEDYPVLKPLEERLDFTIHRLGPGMGTTFLAFNMNTDTDPESGKPYLSAPERNWFNDPEFRRAVARGLDRQAMVDIALNGLGVPQYGPVSPSNEFFHNPHLDSDSYNPEKAREILEENGYRIRPGDKYRSGPEGNKISINLLTHSGNEQRLVIAQIIRSDLANLDFDVNFNQVEFNTLVNKLNVDRDWEAVVIGFTGGPDPHFGRNVWLSSGDLHLWHPRQKSPARSWEAKIDSIFGEAARAVDRKKRQELYYQWQEIVAKYRPVVYTANPEVIYAVSDRLTGVEPTVIGGIDYNIEEIGVRR